MASRDTAPRTASGVRAALRARSDPEKAALLPRYFRAEKGGYGEGDRFLGVIVPEQRKVARRARHLPLHEIAKLLDDPYHECRLTALFILVDRYGRSDPGGREEVAELYLRKLDRVNNWDLVDASAHKILGPHLRDGDRSLLYELARSGHLWRQRAAVIATMAWIREDDFDDTLALADLLLEHPHDLVHKAVGWTLREVGNRDRAVLEGFLATRYARMPRTMLRYAIEKLPESRRQDYLRGRV